VNHSRPDTEWAVVPALRAVAGRWLRHPDPDTSHPEMRRPRKTGAAQDAADADRPDDQIDIGTPHLRVARHKLIRRLNDATGLGRILDGDVGDDVEGTSPVHLEHKLDSAAAVIMRVHVADANDRRAPEP
jgi:hypothetical protein